MAAGHRDHPVGIHVNTDVVSAARVPPPPIAEIGVTTSSLFG